MIDPNDFADWLEIEPSEFLKMLVHEMRLETLKIQLLAEMLQGDLQAKSQADLAEQVDFCKYIVSETANLRKFYDLAVQYAVKLENQE
jgi:hypothetical protein